MTKENSSIEGVSNPQADMLNALKEFIRILDSTTRFNLLQALFVYRNLNLSQLSQLLEVSKSTVLHHLKKFEELNLVTHTEVKAKFGALPTKVYQFNVAMFDMITHKFDSFVNFHKCDTIEDYKLVLKGKQLFFTMISQIFEKLVQNLTDYENKMKSTDENTLESLFSLMKKNNTWFNIDYLTNERKKYVMEETKNGHIPIRMPDHVETPSEMREIHPYLAFHVVMPIPPILNFNDHTEKKKRKKINTDHSKNK